MYILGIETSCDETAAAIVEDGRKIISSIVASQTDIHALYGGIVPEIASRAHVESISAIINQSFEKAGLSMNDIDAVAITFAPGLIGALLTGLSFAKSLAYSVNKPLIPVHHIRGHVAANYLVFPDLEPPFYALTVSGGHTSLMLVENYCHYKTIGVTRDDAAGEAFDKIARVLGLPYPGGAVMDKLASKGDASRFKFTISNVEGAEYDFSFSGLKTAAVNQINKDTMRGEIINEKYKEDMAASFTNILIETIITKLQKLIENNKPMPIVLSGGVAANSHLRKSIEVLCLRYDIKSYIPPLSLCGDNGAMIAAQGYYEYKNNNISQLNQNAFATLDV